MKARVQFFSETKIKTETVQKKRKMFYHFLNKNTPMCATVACIKGLNYALMHVRHFKLLLRYLLHHFFLGIIRQTIEGLNNWASCRFLGKHSGHEVFKGGIKKGLCDIDKFERHLLMIIFFCLLLFNLQTKNKNYFRNI